MGPGGHIGPLTGLRGRAPDEIEEIEEMLSFRSQICCFVAQKNHHRFFLILFFVVNLKKKNFVGQNVLLAEIRDIAEKDIA